VNTARNQLPNACEASVERVDKFRRYDVVVDDLLRRPEHGGETTISILLAADRADDQGMMFGVAGRYRAVENTKIILSTSLA
jgi:hypothetical protein